MINSGLVTISAALTGATALPLLGIINVSGSIVKPSGLSFIKPINLFSNPSDVSDILEYLKLDLPSNTGFLAITNGPTCITRSAEATG